MELISTRQCFVSTTGKKSPMNRFAVSRHIVNIPVNKFIMLIQGLLLLAVYGFSQEDSSSLGQLQIKIADSLAIDINAHDNHSIHPIVGRDSLIGAYKGKIFSNDAGSEVFKIIIRSDSTGEQFVLYCAKKNPVKIERGEETYYKHNNRYFNKDSHVLTDPLMLQKIKGLEWVLEISYKLINAEP